MDIKLIEINKLFFFLAKYLTLQLYLLQNNTFLLYLFYFNIAHFIFYIVVNKL